MNIDITQIIVALLGILGAVITGWLIPYLKSKTTKEQWETVTAWVQTGVEAAEVLYKGAGQGAIKKQTVIDYINKQCAAHNIKVDMDSVEYAIEQAWKSMTEKQVATAG